MSLLFLPQRTFTSLTTNKKHLIPTILGILTTLTFSILTILLTTRYISRISLPLDRPHWSQIAREQAYNICYDGCNDCLDVSSIAAACRLTTKVQLTGVICDAQKMWTWGDYDSKFPQECLAAVGELYREDALERNRFWWKGLYGLVLLAVPLGYAVFLGVERLMRKINARSGNAWGGEVRPRVRTPNASARNSDTRTPLLAATILTLALVPQVDAYACLKGQAYDQLFADPSNTLFGVVHGWLSNCQGESYSCGETCTTTSSAGSSYRDCNTNWCNEEKVDKTPQVYVNAVVPLIRKCGLRLVDHVPGVIDKRVANTNIEGRFWVKISVNRINSTDGSGLDQYVDCLWWLSDSRSVG